MGFTILRLKVEDFEKWNNVFGKGKETRLEANIKFRVFSTAGNRNEVWILAEFGDPAKFKAYMESPKSKEASAKAGILGTPEVFPLVHEFDE
ncbi:MAG: hypothetical protein ACXABG_04485 [Promethearchaeota archaeon]|jgi:quinol monooxygenase YgiN